MRLLYYLQWKYQGKNVYTLSVQNYWLADSPLRLCIHYTIYM